MSSAAFHRAALWNAAEDIRDGGLIYLGSVLSPVLFLLYTAEVLFIVHHHGPADMSLIFTGFCSRLKTELYKHASI